MNEQEKKRACNGRVLQIDHGPEDENSIQKNRNFKLTLIYLTLSPKYKLDDNHKTKIDTFDWGFFP